jgi:hypothetical protein
MATDPVQQIRELEHDTPLATNLNATLARLAALPPSTEAPYLTVSLDWRPEGSAPGRFEAPEPKRSERRAPGEEDGAPRRPAWQELRRDLDETVNSYGPRGAAFESLTTDMERLTTYLNEELDPVATGVVVIACHHQGSSSRFRSTSQSTRGSLSGPSRCCASSPVPRMTIRPTPSSPPINGTPSSG